MIHRIIALGLLAVLLVSCGGEKKDCGCFPIDDPIFLPEPFTPFAVVQMPDQSLQQVSFTMQPKVHMARGWYTNKAMIAENTNNGWPATPGSMQITITIWPFHDSDQATLENIVSYGAGAKSLEVGGLAAVRTEYLDTQNSPSEGFVITAKIDDTFYVMFQVQTAIGEKDKFEDEALEIINTFQVTDIQPIYQ